MPAARLQYSTTLELNQTLMAGQMQNETAHLHRQLWSPDGT